MPPPWFRPHPLLDAVLLDLDNTLCPTDHLQRIRMHGDRTQLAPHLPGLCAYPGIDDVLAGLAGVIPVGVVSRTHRWYMEDVIGRLFPGFPWAATVSYDDVVNQKPHPESLLLAAQRLGLQDRSRIAYLGDTQSDIEAAYHAGMRTVLCTWEPSPYHLARAQQMVPDAVLAQPSDVLAYVADPEAFLPHLEARLAQRGAPAGTRRPAGDFGGPGAAFRVDVLGRYFADVGPTLALHERHLLSRWMDLKDEPGRFEHPLWVSAVAEAVAAAVQEQQIDTVSVIPAKPAGTPRMERLLAGVQPLLAQAGGPAVRFAPGLLAFTADAARIKHMGQAQRAAEIERSLSRAGNCFGERVLVMDDVLTTGASLRRARSLLLQGGAAYVSALALAKTVSGYQFSVDPESRTCKLCGRPMKLTRNRYGGRFWGCVGYWDTECRYTENV